MAFESKSTDVPKEQPSPCADNKKVYSTPQLVPLDHSTALERLREAAAKGNTKAQAMLTQASSQTSGS